MEQIHAKQFLQMMHTGAAILQKNVEVVNALNVFPVPDGDTGTNMSLTIRSGVEEMAKRTNADIGQLAEALSKGLLMGARGNSGVILSQLFRGFAKALSGKKTMNARQLADAFYQGVETAYKAVIKPVEGTVLTVAREAADAGMKEAWSTQDPTHIMEAIYRRAKEILAKTPEMLSVLEQTNVVDAGGQGLVYIYEGMLTVLSGEKVEDELVNPTISDQETLAEQAHRKYAGADLNPENIEHGYCTEFIIQLQTKRRWVDQFEESAFRKQMAGHGDSLLIVADEEYVKVHIHAETPGEVLNDAMRYGDLDRIKIDNMREQHRHVTGNEPTREETPAKPETVQPFGVLVIAVGEGNAQVFKSLGADLVITGGQTMNPSAEEIAEAIQQLNAEHVFVLPNNKNIILTAKQAAHFVDVPITVFDTRTIPQGMAALFAFDQQNSLEVNQQKMAGQIQEIRSGEVTYAVRDTEINGFMIAKGDYLGLADGEIRYKGLDLFRVAEELIEELMEEEAELVTIIYGQEVTEEQAEEWKTELEKKYPDHEFEVHDGGQPLYYFLIGVE